ncbi:STN domain-containing protein [Bradyrhizobium sp. Ai1a-2]|uniref:STN domain-containing protein n=1 Tax=Bradyrhizobium sp. Ai1a-2 TaxID=196490 RepID=UPI0012688908|nr:STN domain-containing protein [Bradyrhizobium sp. Ai1a-2]
MPRILHAAVMVVMAAVALTGVALPSGAGSPTLESALGDGAERSYAIPTQPLKSALMHYARVSGAQVLYETALVAGRQSTVLEGRMSQAAALERLLSGTGLAALRTEPDTFVIMLDLRRAAERPAPVPDRRLLGALQHGVLDVLCQTSATRPGRYTVSLKLWVGANGAVTRSALIGTSGDTARDALLIDRLRGAFIGLAPPPDMPQPLVFTLKQQAAGTASACPD